MISLIICSRSIDLPLSLKENINETIGENYEVIVIDNSQNKYSIFSAYNEGARKAKGDIYCFMHEDIMYETKDWGQKVLKHFQEKDKLGLIGVFGGHYMPDCVCHIGDSDLLSGMFYFTDKGLNKKSCFYNQFFGNYTSIEVVAVDGLWFCIPKKLFDEISFDEKTYNGFHYYDMDISMQIWSVGYTCEVVSDILVNHFSSGNINKNFIYSSYDFYKKWHSCFPMLKGISIDHQYVNIIKDLCRNKAYCRELLVENKEKRACCIKNTIKLLLKK